MSTLIHQIQDRISKRIRYAKTVSELRNLPIDTALDLDLYHGDAEKIAAQAVYGEPLEAR